MTRHESGLTDRSEAEARLRAAGIASVPLARIRDGGLDHVALLVSDEDFDRAGKATRAVAGEKVRLFNASGGKAGGFRLDRSDYRAITIAILPTWRAEALLTEVRERKLGERDRFHLAAYVSAYFGGARRLLGLAPPEDTAADLAGLADAAGVTASACTSRAALDAYLAGTDWRPPLDMLERLALADPWLRTTVLGTLADGAEAPPGLTVFFARQKAVEAGRLEVMLSAIRDAGFEILWAGMLGDDLAGKVRRIVRGGNWGVGPWPTSGGPPVHLSFAVDVFPLPPDAETLAQHPFLDNARTLAAKLAARDAVLDGVPAARQYNPLHSADSTAETLRLARTILAPDEFTSLEQTYRKRIAEVEPMQADAARLDLNDSVALALRTAASKGHVLRKLYRPHYRDEIAASVRLAEDLAGDWPEVAAVRHADAFRIDYADPGDGFRPLASLRGPARVATVRRLRAVLRATLAAGYDPVGWDPGSGVLVSADGRDLRLPGFDRLRPCPPGAALASAMSLGVGTASDRYRKIWYPALGMPRSVFLSGGPMAMHLHQRLVYPAARGAMSLADFGRRARRKARLSARRLGQRLRRSS